MIDQGWETRSTERWERLRPLREAAAAHKEAEEATRVAEEAALDALVRFCAIGLNDGARVETLIRTAAAGDVYAAALHSEAVAWERVLAARAGECR